MNRRTFLRAVLWAGVAAVAMGHHRPGHQTPPGHQDPDPDPDPEPERPPTGTLTGDYPDGIHLTGQDAEIQGLVTTPRNVTVD